MNSVKKRQKENNVREKAITEENKVIYTNMIVYLRGSDLTNYDQEVVRADIIEMILDGQERGDSIQQVMGEQYQEICDEIIEVMPKKTKKETILEFCATTIKAVAILGLISLVAGLIDNCLGGTKQFVFTLTVGDVFQALAIIIAANLIITGLTKKAFDSQGEKKIFAVSVFLVFIGLLGSFYMKTMVLSISIWLAAILLLVLFLFGVLISQKIDRKKRGDQLI